MRQRKLKMWMVLMAMGSMALWSVNSESSIPTRITDDTVIFQKLRELNINKEVSMDFDQDISRLAGMEKRYQEDGLPRLYRHKRLKRVTDRISQKKRASKRTKKRRKSKNKKRTSLYVDPDRNLPWRSAASAPRPSNNRKYQTF